VAQAGVMRLPHAHCSNKQSTARSFLAGPGVGHMGVSARPAST